MWQNDDLPFGRRRPRGSIWLPTIVSLVLQVPVAAVTFHVALGASALPAIAVLLGIGSSFALLARRRYPGPTVVAAGLLSASAIAFGAGPPLAAVPLAIAVVSGILHAARIWVWSTLAGVALVVPTVAYAATQTQLASIRPLAVALVLCFFVGFGEVFRNRRERFREVSRSIAARRRSEAEAERLRIARELHDVLAHSLSQISVQAGVGLHLFDAQPEQARHSLEAIRLTSGQALEEVRGVLGFLRQEGAVPGDEAARSPAPDLSRLPDLVGTYTASGLDVTLDTRIDVDPSRPVQLAVYRIVQEALTNVRRHATASTATVSITVDGAGCRLVIVDDGRAQDATVQPGRGITGMRERAELLGGTLATSLRAGGGFVVEAELPSHPAPRRAPSGDEVRR
ncbi:hypothetical protein AX769_14050 [Frondihabitans sp. PAMC 28766]|uniref:sensor histidine kinase n=1 Tax=Frondihabitans sp. PAMC 28766 TaxID=1795630 RepID=UPI00078BAC02|nr:sensor histidine kinase [Frondihabitans sp. PAMC 28766]AMM21054.1 hypothetical protein AX769_14050 [Frondihabitans sp. PAMC 28766]